MPETTETTKDLPALSTEPEPESPAELATEALQHAEDYARQMSTEAWHAAGQTFDKLRNAVFSLAAMSLTANQASAAPLARAVSGEAWISVEERLPEVGSWVNVLVDRETGDYFDRRGRERYEVHGAQLRWIDEEGYASWQRWVMPDGGPIGSLRMVTHWQYLPAAPTSTPSAAKKD